MKAKEIILDRGRLYIQKQRSYVYVYIRVNGLLPGEAQLLEWRYGGSRWSACFFYSWSSCNVISLHKVLIDLASDIYPQLHQRLIDYCLSERGKPRTQNAYKVADLIRCGSVDLKEFVE